MILVLAGTLDGRDLAVKLSGLGKSVMVSVVSEYGRSLAQEEVTAVHSGPLDLAGMRELIAAREVKAIIDASHPYAVNASINAMRACDECKIKYIRYERAEVEVPALSNLHVVDDVAEAAKAAARLGKIVFLTTGSRALKVFKSEPALAETRVIARVLPQPDIIRECIDLGFSPRDIVAMQGPFSHELNVAMFKHCQADVIVTKNSGVIGGTDTKMSAAMELGLPLVVVGRPNINYRNLCRTQAEVIEMLLEDK